MLVLHEGIKDQPKSRVELHIHLDGAVRVETAWDLLRQKQLPLPGDGSLAALREVCSGDREPLNLARFLAPFNTIAPAFQGDVAAIERMAREFVEDRSRDHVAYCEARFSPHLLLPFTESSDDASSWMKTAENGSSTNGKASTNGDTVANGSSRDVTIDDVMEAVLKGVKAGEQQCPGTKVRLLLCCIRGLPQWSADVLRMCEQYADRGVVGIDIAGSHAEDGAKGAYDEGAEIFQAAAAKGIHRTVHAGEDAPAASVLSALDDLKAERIGHGYRVLEDEAIYQRCRDAGIHFEVCPHSSYLTGAMNDLSLSSKRHPVIRFATDGTSYSVNTDDPIITGTSLSDEYALLGKWGFTEAHTARANFNAAMHSFLPAEEKQLLLQQLREAYGVADYSPPVTASEGSGKVSPNKPTITFNTWENRA